MHLSEQERQHLAAIASGRRWPLLGVILFCIAGLITWLNLVDPPHSTITPSGAVAIVLAWVCAVQYNLSRRLDALVKLREGDEATGASMPAPKEAH